MGLWVVCCFVERAVDRMFYEILKIWAFGRMRVYR